MKHFLLTLCLIVGIGISTTAVSAEESKTDLSDAQKSQLTEVMYGFLTVQDLVKEEIITKNQAENANKIYKERAEKIAPGYGSLQKLITIQPGSFQVQNPAELTFLQKMAGFVSMINILWTLAIIIGIICFIFLCGDLITIIAISIPPIVYEFFLYMGSLSVIWYGTTLSESVSPWVGFTGCLLIAGALQLTSFIHKKIPEVFMFSILFFLYSGIAIWYMSSMIGFIAIIALMGALGFSVAIHPGCYVLGFKKEDELAKATSTGFLLLTIYCVTKIMGINNEYLQIFQFGALFMGSFVGYLGLLIASSRWYGNRQLYPVMQMITIIAGVAAIVIGSIWDITLLQKIGGTFFILYLMEKMLEIPMRSLRGYAFLGLIMSIVVYSGSVYIKTHIDLFGPYMPF